MFNYLVVDCNNFFVAYQSNDVDRCMDFVESMFARYHEVDSFVVCKVIAKLEEEGDGDAKIHDSDCG